jgi:thioredoxin reductase (NADPH)
MKLSHILALDDDEQVLEALRRDLRQEFRKDYRIIATTSAEEALASLGELKKKGETVALFLSDQRMPEMLGVEFLKQARVVFPDAKKVILTAYSDIDAAVRAINEVQLDYYITKPWDPPAEKLFPVLHELLSDWQATHQSEFDGLRLVGYQFSPRSHDLKDFLSGNLIPYQWLNIETEPKAAELLRLHDIAVKDLPVAVLADGSVLIQPTIQQLAENLKFTALQTGGLYDLAIIGAGPAGLAAAVYGGSEGLKTILLDKRAPGGQAGTSSRIENYLGFPSGVTGAELSQRAITQAKRFGVEFLVPCEVTKIKSEGQYKRITLADDTEIITRAILLSTGVAWRKLEVASLDKFTGAGVYYGAATTEAFALKGQQVYVVGGGNSAGQGAMFLSRTAAEVFICIRRPDLSETMSQYLIDQIKATPNITLLPCTEITDGAGTDKLERLTIKDLNSGETRQADAAALFIFIGAKPLTDWIEVDIIKDDKGFIETGRDLVNHPRYRQIWKQSREPYSLETCSTGIFAAGDVRAGAMNRVASAVGEGAMAVSFVHKYLAES